MNIFPNCDEYQSLDILDIESVAIMSENKNIFITGGIDANIKIWDRRNGKQYVGIRKGHLADINTVEWFPDNKAFGSGSDDATVRLWDLRAIKELNQYVADDIFGSVTSIDFSKSGRYLFAAYDEEPFCVTWNTIKAEIAEQQYHDARVSSLQLSPDGYNLATGSWDHIIRVWSTQYIRTS